MDAERADEWVIGGYRLGRCLGVGATATVHEGVRVADGTPVAVKVLHPEFTDNPELVERFRREARTLRTLTHPNIVGFVDFVDAAPTFAFVMELLDGETLEAHLKRQVKLPEDHCLVWVEAMARALAEAHVKSVVHRDVKPANVFLTREGRVVLSDFGLARPEHDKVTRAGQKMLGTPLYMAPEQVVGRTATPATDIYQVGVCLFEMLTGERPFARENDYERILARLEEDLFVPLDRPVSPGMRELVRRSGFKDPHRRYPSGHVLLEDVLALRAGKPMPYLPPDPELPRQATLTAKGLDWRDPKHYRGTLLVCPRINLRYDPAGKPFFVGSDPGVEVYLESREIAPRQLRFRPAASGWILETGNFQAEVRLQGQRVAAGNHPLASGSLLEVAGYEFLWVDHPDEARPAPPPTAAAAPAPPSDLTAHREPPAPAARGGCLAMLLAGLAATALGAGFPGLAAWALVAGALAPLLPLL